MIQKFWNWKFIQNKLKGHESEDEIYESVNRLNLFKTTSSTIHPVAAQASLPADQSSQGTAVGAPVAVGRFYEYSDGDYAQETEMVKKVLLGQLNQPLLPADSLRIKD